MLRLSKIFYLFIFLAILQSCDTLQNVSSVNFEIIIPGKMVIPSKYRKAAFRYNNSNVAVNPSFSYYFEDNKIIADSINTDSIASKIYYQVFIDHLKNQQFFDTILDLQPMDYSSIKINDSLVYESFDMVDTTDFLNSNSANTDVYNFTKMLNHFSISDEKKIETKFIDPEFGLYTKNEILQISDSTDADLFISFDFFTSADGIFSPNYKKELSDSLNISTAIFNTNNYATEVVNIISNWNFYDLKKQKLIYSYFKTDTIKWNKPARFLKEAIKVLPPRMDALLNAADIAGRNFAEFLVPHWIEVERMYYRSGHLELKKTDELIKQNRWLEAAEIWKKNTTNKNKSIAAKSMFNMALACEMNGDMDAAMDWAIKSFYVFGSDNETHAYNCQSYIKILAQRKQDIKKIEKQ